MLNHHSDGFILATVTNYFRNIQETYTSFISLTSKLTGLFSNSNLFLSGVEKYTDGLLWKCIKC